MLRHRPETPAPSSPSEAPQLLDRTSLKLFASCLISLGIGTSRTRPLSKMSRSSLRMWSPLLRSPGTSSFARVTPVWEGLLLRRTFVTRTPQAALPRASLPGSTPKSKNNPLKATRRSFYSNPRLRAPKAAPKAGGNAQGLTARLKKLSREYGWTAVGVYLALSVLDFPFCFMLVRVVGTEKIGTSQGCSAMVHLTRAGS